MPEIPAPTQKRLPFAEQKRARSRWIVPLAIASTLLLVAALCLAACYDPLARASAAYSAGDYRGALRVAQDVLKRRPHDRRAALLAARCLSRLGRPRQAADQFELAGQLVTEAADLHDRAFAMALSDQPERAAEFYDEILAQWPDDELALKRLAAVRMSRKEWTAVQTLASRLVALPRGEVAGATLAAIAHHELKQYAQAITAAERVLEIDPELKDMPLPSGLFWNNLALDLMAVGRSPDARAHLARVIQGPRDANLMELLGLTYFQDGHMDQAEACWRKAVEWNPSNADALLGLGRLALNRNQPETAVKWLSLAADASPDALEPVYNLSRAYRLLGKPDEARRLEQRAATMRAARPASGGMDQPTAERARQPSRGGVAGTAR
jgi:tetratricopeptide (TPR) repeat protein